jgi:DNA mismatch repair protein MutS
MMRQYREIKAQYPDAVLLYRLGDFYEMFFEDALLASRELDLVLTGRECGLEERAPMCGVPFHSADGYIAKLVARGHKVAICEQTEDPSQAKGLVRREVIRVLTPGTVIEPSMLDESRNNYLACLLLAEEGAGLCFADISTGMAEVTELRGKDVLGRVANELAKYLPTELLVSAGAIELPRLRETLRRLPETTVEPLPEPAFAEEDCRTEVLRHFHDRTLDELELAEEPLALRALGAALRYLREAQKAELNNIRSVECYSERQLMRLDAASRRNLELSETMRGREKRGSLLWVLDRTRTAMGKRLLRAWLERPLLHLPRITRRQNAVGELLERTALRLDLRDALAEIHDLERLMARVIYAAANARELRALADSLERLPGLKGLLAPCKTEMLREICRDVDPLEDMAALVRQALTEEPPFSLREGGLIRDGYYPELDELRAIVRDGKGFIAGIQAQEQERTGIKKLKIGYNRVFGYYIEVSNAYRELVPDEYIRKQTLANCERYITQQLKDLEAKVLGAQERIVRLEYEIFTQLREDVAGQYHRIRRSARAAATLDALCSLAETAAANHYCRPEVTTGDEIEITEGRHPVVEQMLDGTPFVSNHTSLRRDAGADGCRCAIITGPNMAGKSTYMRQVALITLLAQVGSFVPAERATIGMVDSIFTRVGASDDLAAGQSTFLVEMREVAQILQNATPQSLLIFDEIGRGTSTFDGMSIAQAVLEYAANPKTLGAKTLFATHYHELTELEGQVPGVRNFAVAVKKRGDDITFLRRIIRGSADGSFGIEVAKMAGVPGPVVRRAKEVLRELEAQERDKVQGTGAAALLAADKDEAGLEDLQVHALAEELAQISTDTLTPLEALTKLYGFVQKAREIG